MHNLGSAFAIRLFPRLPHQIRSQCLYWKTPRMSSPPTPASLSDRYSRQILFAGIGSDGQDHLARAHVAIVGVGATGAASASLLARSGVGRITLIDRDFVESSNLQRQILFDEADALACLPKAEAGRRKILLFNSSISVEARITDLVPSNIHDLLKSAQLILDCTDNFEDPLPSQRLLCARIQAMDLCRRHRSLRGHHEHPSQAKRTRFMAANRLSLLSFS